MQAPAQLSMSNKLCGYCLSNEASLSVCLDNYWPGNSLYCLWISMEPLWHKIQLDITLSQYQKLHLVACIAIIYFRKVPPYQVSILPFKCPLILAISPQNPFPPDSPVRVATSPTNPPTQSILFTPPSEIPSPFFYTLPLKNIQQLFHCTGLCQLSCSFVFFYCYLFVLCVCFLCVYT